MNWYEIRVQGHLDQRWSEWFAGLTITYDADENTVLRGPLPDEAALHGVLIKVRDLTLPLLAVNRIAGDAAEPGTSVKESHHATGGVDGPPADAGTSR
jgi:hypothetical protein